MKRIVIAFCGADPVCRTAAFAAERFDEAAFCFVDPAQKNERERQNLRAFLQKRHGVTATFCELPDLLPDTLDPFFDRFTADAEAVFDLTEADPRFVSAATAYGVTHPNGSLRFYDPAALTAAEHISLCGGKVMRVSGDGSYDFTDPSFQQEILRMWQATKDIPNDWNRFCSLPFERENGDFHAVFRRFGGKDDRAIAERVLRSLARQGVVAQSGVTGAGASYTLGKAAKTKELYEKSGTALELFVCLAAARCGSFYDAQTGVQIDLDGVVTNAPSDPHNEIDVLAMHRGRPVFISCKNTRPTKEFLYEIQTVATSAGGKTAVPVIVSTEPAFPAVSERARDMDILLLDDLRTASLKSLKNMLTGFFPKEDSIPEN